MSRQVTFDYSKAGSFISEEEIGYMKKLTLDAKETLVSKTGAGNDFLGWIDLPVDYDKEEFARIKAAAAKIREDSDVLVVAGIGGSYLGARAVIEAVKAAGYTKVILRPLMVVAGDHANNDMAGSDDDSWLSMFNASDAFESVDCQIAGLGEIEDVQKLYVAHTKAAIDSLNG